MSQIPVRVLMVDDDEDDVVLARDLLHEADPIGYELDWIADFDDALGKLQQAGYDVCLVDYRLGLRDGVDFITQATNRGIGAPIILLTGQGDRAVDVAAMNAGASDFLNKSQLSASLLERAIRYSIQQKKAEQQRIRLLMEQAARAEAEAANRSKDEFLAVLSHELRTPLTAVLLNVSALEQETQPDQKAREMVQVIKRNVDLEARLIDDLLDLTRIARGKLELRREVVDLHEQIDYAVRCSCATEIEQKNIHVTVHAQAEFHHVWGDPARLQQVLWNLIKNAVKFTPQGGRIDIESGQVNDGRMFVEVRDMGIGIKPEALPKIFNAFEQADRSITRRFGGLGLGLAICKAIVELHGGRIRADSTGVGHGATFRVELPVTASAPENQAAPSLNSPAARATNGLSILLVEDHADTARAMGRLLRRRGYSVHAATTMTDALAAARGRAFDLIISDIGLPDGSGLELMRQLLAERPIKGIALTGFGMEEDVERSRAAGFSEHLTKPIDMSQLQAALDRVIRAEQPVNAGS
ncbi:MAG TPA: response regulator [Tepidisphaeraceae bacterium]|nr:response regulator [Tepidisphaeraceae bacterium]